MAALLDTSRWTEAWAALDERRAAAGLAALPPPARMRPSTLRAFDAALWEALRGGDWFDKAAYDAAGARFRSSDGRLNGGAWGYPAEYDYPDDASHAGTDVDLGAAGILSRLDAAPMPCGGWPAGGDFAAGYLDWAAGLLRRMRFLRLAWRGDASRPLSVRAEGPVFARLGAGGDLEAPSYGSGDYASFSDWADSLHDGEDPQGRKVMAQPVLGCAARAQIGLMVDYDGGAYSNPRFRLTSVACDCPVESATLTPPCAGTLHLHAVAPDVSIRSPGFDGVYRVVGDATSGYDVDPDDLGMARLDASFDDMGSGLSMGWNAVAVEEGGVFEYATGWAPSGMPAGYADFPDPVPGVSYWRYHSGDFGTAVWGIEIDIALFEPAFEHLAQTQE